MAQEKNVLRTPNFGKSGGENGREDNGHYGSFFGKLGG